MSLAEDGPIYEKLCKHENTYQVINRIAKLARHKSKECDYHILDSVALTCAIHGVDPTYKRPNRTDKCITRYEYSYIKELLCYVDDSEIRAAVEESYRESKAARNLIYVYKTIDDEPRMARVRVLVRMVWYNIAD